MKPDASVMFKDRRLERVCWLEAEIVVACERPPEALCATLKEEQGDLGSQEFLWDEVTES